MRLLEVPDCAQCVICQVYTDTICEVPAKTLRSIHKYLQTQTHIPTEPPDTNTYTFRYLKTKTPVQVNIGANTFTSTDTNTYTYRYFYTKTHIQL